jgi:putative phage-type endonuclease
MSRDKWLEVRRETIGGSDAGAICGLNPYSSAYHVYADKLGLIAPQADNEAMRQGRDLEQYVAERFCEETGKKVRRENSMIYNTDYPFAHADVDRLIVGENAGLECKTANPLHNADYLSGSYPDHYYAQCMHYMMVTGKPKWYLAVLVYQKGLYIFTIERNEEEIAVLADIEKTFYENCIIGKMEPPADGAPSTTETLSERFAQSNGESIDLTLCQNEIEQYCRLKLQKKELEQLMDEQLNVIKSFMKEAERGECGDRRITWKTQERRQLDKKRLAQDYPEINLEDYMNISTSRPFKIT